MSAAGELRTRVLANAFDLTSSEGAWMHVLDDLGDIGANARPVVIQGGLSTQDYLYEPLKRLLQQRGFDVFVTEMPSHGFASLHDDAEALARTVEAARRFSLRSGGDGLVNVVGHSKGGLSSRYFLQRMGGIDRVAQLVTVGTPHKGTMPLGSGLAAAIMERMPGLPGVKQLSGHSHYVQGLNADFPSFMARARQQQPGFRVTSLAGDLDLPALRGTDLLVTTTSAALDDTLTGVRNLVFRGDLPHHGAIVGQYGMHEPTLRAMVQLLAGQPVDDVARGAGALARR